MNYILSVVKNLYRKYYLSKITYSKTKLFLESKLQISVDEMLKIENEFNEVISSESYAIGGPQSVLKDDAFALYALVRNLKPNLMIETGTYQGYSSHVIIEALKKNNQGKFITCDIEDCRVFKNDFNQIDYRFLLGPSSSTFQSIPFDKVDVFFHDSDHRFPNVKFEIGTAVTNKVAIILCHDFGKENIHNTIKAEGGKGCREGFIDSLDDNYVYLEIPTINGIGLAIRKNTPLRRWI